MKTLKKAAYILSIFSLAISLTACFDNFLEVDPVSDITSGSFWDSEESVRAELNSVYATIQQAYNGTDGANFLSWMEARSDNFFGIVKANEMPLLDVSLNKLNSGMPSSNWNLFYSAINRCNYAIHYLPTIKKISLTSYNSLHAEAHALRAFLYFTLLKIWGSVPVITEPTLTVEDVKYPARDSREKVLQQAISDIEVAMATPDAAATDVFLLNAGSTYALAAHIYVWADKYQEAINAIEKLEALKRYELVNMNSFLSIFSKSNTKENIWSLEWVYANNKANAIIQSLCGLSSQLPLSEPIRELWQTEPYRSKDLRRACTLDTTQVAPLPNNHLSVPGSKIGCFKFFDGAFGGYGNDNPWVMFRYADIVLLHAESYNRLSNTVSDQKQAIVLLNKVRQRAGLPGYNYDNDFAGTADPQKAILDAILQERRLELVGEGHRFFDLMRNDLLSETMNAYYESYYKVKSSFEYRLYTEEYMQYFPIYNDNIIENGNLVQEGNY